MLFFVSIGLNMELIDILEIVEPDSEFKIYKYGSVDTTILLLFIASGFEKKISP